MPPVLTQEEAMEAAAPGKPALCAFGGREHAAVICLQDSQMQYTLLALMPSADMAWSWAHSAQEAGTRLSASLSALLIEGSL